MNNGFNGFSEDIRHFFTDLAENNSKDWFEAHRQVYESVIKGSAIAFVEEMGERLKAVRPDMVADPRINKSIFRLNRDTRFSKDKRPYKTHLGIFFWEGNRPKLENPGLYVQVDANGMFMGSGMHLFPPDILKAYRSAVDDTRQGEHLENIVADLKSKGIQLGGSHYKTVPRGFARDHVRGDLMKHNGLFASREIHDYALLASAAIADTVFEFFMETLPLHEWVLTLY